MYISKVCSIGKHRINDVYSDSSKPAAPNPFPKWYYGVAVVYNLGSIYSLVYYIMYLEVTKEEV